MVTVFGERELEAIFTMSDPRLPQYTLRQFEAEFGERQLIHQTVDYWAARKPGEPAIINATRDKTTDWRTFAATSRALAAELLRLGLRKGDFLVTSLPLLDEHIFLEYACFRIGVIHVPLDLRLSPPEVLRAVSLVGAKAYVFLGKTAAADFSALGAAVKANCPAIRHLIQFSPPADCIAGALSAFDLAAQANARAAEPVDWPAVDPGDGAQVIFTTGSTGSPKPALLSHRGIAAQNLCLGGAFEFSDSRVMVHLPPSHVGCQAELLMSGLFWGGTAVTLEIFDPAKTLEAIEKYRVRLLGQIPAMFLMEWRHSDFAKRDLSSLEIAVYGGQAVPRPFLEKLRAMAPRIATGLGLTETSGFCTYTAPTGNVDELASSIGHALPIYPMTIRRPMLGDGKAGEEVPLGEIGHVCFRGPQNFLGYVNDPEATAQALSSDGYLYTGDMGFLAADGLHFAGRAKWVIKPAGYQVFPGDVENHFCALAEKVAACGVIGVEHPIWLEAIVAFVEKRPGADLTESELRRHARGLTSYMRPLHYVIVEPGQLPLNRVAKIDNITLKRLAEEEVARLRERGRWAAEVVEE
jgi:acyl-CoA synthetase (AMP-forming)/AMP-acid ligase II